MIVEIFTMSLRVILWIARNLAQPVHELRSASINTHQSSAGKLRWFRPDRRLHESYAETAFEEVIEANRRGTWAINAVTGN